MDEVLQAHLERVARLRGGFERLLTLHQRLSDAREESWHVVSREDPSLEERVDELQQVKALLSEEIDRVRAETFPAPPATVVAEAPTQGTAEEHASADDPVPSPPAAAPRNEEDGDEPG